ncbi:MAG: DEAD/DEAH box helicase [Acidimicrobiales bacterium]
MTGQVGPAANRATVLPAYTRLIHQLNNLQAVSDERAALVEAALSVWRKPGFDTLAALSELRFEPFDYQLRAASVVLKQMSGRAILADEVGLGKTIEAGIVITELRQRGLAPNVLVLAPTGLVGQWGEELERKFGCPTVVASRDGWRTAAVVPEGSRLQETPIDAPLTGEPEAVVIASLATARRDPLRSRLSSLDWDLVVVDEAHRIRNPRTASSLLVRSLRSRYLLLLTATPVENRLDDLFQLVSLVRPGHLGTAADFRRRYGVTERDPRPTTEGADADVKSRSTLRSAAARAEATSELRRSLRGVMIRHRRSEVARMLPRRLAETVIVTPLPAERALYAEISERVRAEARAAGPGREMVLKTVQRLAGSSPLAVAPTLERAGWWDLVERAKAADGCAKTDALAGLLDRHLAAGEKVIVFTSFRDTLSHLCEWAASTGRNWSAYHGSLSRRDKNAAIAVFETETDVLFSTESAGEGRNLQFCHAMINFDLPWNPMQIEQRLGRIHRIGQTHDVVLTNMATRGTLEESILNLLHSKLNLFELVIGELDMVLGRISDDFVFEDAVFEAHVRSDDEATRAAQIERLGDMLIEARQAHIDSRSRTDELVATLEGDEEAAGDDDRPRVRPQ